MRQLAEIIKGTAHVELLSGAHVKQREIHRAAAAVAGFARDISSLKQLLLLQIRVKIGLHAQIEVLDAPQHKVFHRACWTIRIEHLDPIALGVQLARHGLERPRRLNRQKRHRLLVAVDAIPHKIVGGVVANLLDDPRNIVRQQHEAAGIHGHLLFVIHLKSPFIAVTQRSRQSAQARPRAASKPRPAGFPRTCVYLFFKHNPVVRPGDREAEEGGHLVGAFVQRALYGVVAFDVFLGKAQADVMLKGRAGFRHAYHQTSVAFTVPNRIPSPSGFSESARRSG